MRLISDAVMQMRVLRSRRGSQMVEAAIVLPVLILTVMLLLRAFVFYLQIINTGVSEHMDALESCDSYRGSGLKQYSSQAEVGMARGGVLRHNLSKRIDTRLYMLNEDLMVRAGEALSSD